MLHSKEDIKELYQDIGMILINGDRYNDKVTSLEDLQERLRRKDKFKEIDFQDKDEGGNSLGDLLLKHATENDNSRVQEQIIPATNEEKEEEQNAPGAEENKADSNEVDSSNSSDAQFSMSYNKIKEIVTNNPNITAKEFYEEVKKRGKTDTKICDLFMDVIRSGEPDILNDRDTFLKIVKLLMGSDIKIIKDTASKTILDYAVASKQDDVVKILLGSNKFNGEEKFNALRSAIIQNNFQEVQLFLDHVNHVDRVEALDYAVINRKPAIIVVFLMSGKFNEEEKFNALRSVIVQGYVQEAVLFLDYLGSESKRAALDIAMQTEKTRVVDAFLSSGKLGEENRAGPSNSNENVDSRPVDTPNGQLNHNNENETPVVIGAGQTAVPSVKKNKANGFIDAQFSMPNEKETKYKESKKNFYASLRNDVVGVIITGLFIAAAVMTPSVAGAVVCSIVAVLVAVYTGLHVKNSTLPSYGEMEKSRVEAYNQEAPAL